MQLPTRSPRLALLLMLALVVTVLPQPGFAADDNDNKKNDTRESSRQTTAKPSGSPQTASPSGARPDLSITVDGLEPPNVEHTLRFKVTNVGKARSTGIKAKIQTVSGGPANPSEPEVPPLEPGASTLLYYGIGSCDGQVVQATVNDPLDFPSANDRAEKVCPPKPKPGENDGALVAPVGPGSASDALREALLPPIVPESPSSVPEHLRPGVHTLSLSPVASRTLRASRGWDERDCHEAAADIIDEVQYPPFPLMAGFRNFASDGVLDDCQANGVWQAAFTFNLSEIRGLWAAGRLSVWNMDVTFKEVPFRWWRHGSDNKREFWINTWLAPGLGYVPTTTCWPRLARPTASWNGINGLVANTILREADEIGRFPLGDETGDILGSPEEDKLGFVILGHNEEMHYNVAECVSKIEDVNLNVTYVIHER